MVQTPDVRTHKLVHVLLGSIMLSGLMLMMVSSGVGRVGWSGGEYTEDKLSLSEMTSLTKCLVNL